MKYLLPLALVLAPVGAQAQGFDLGEIVVSPNLEPTALNKVGATVDVVGTDALQTAPQGNVAQALTFVPGFTLTANGGLGQRAGFQLRGANQNYVPVLIDGIDVSDPSGPQVAYDFGHLTTAGIGSIEVLKGAQSALYGSSAIGGVIDIQSRHATEPGTHVYTSARYGSRNTADASLSVTTKTDTTDLAATVSHVGSDGYAVFTGAKADGVKAGYWANRLSVNGSHTLANGVKLGFAGFVEENHGPYDPARGATVFASQKSDTGGLRVYAEFKTGAVTNTVSASTFRILRNYNATDYGASSFTGERQKLSYQGAVSLGAKARLVFGADTTRESYVDSFGSSFQRHINGVFSELSYSPTGQVDLTASLRNDHQSGFGDNLTGRLSAAWRPTSDWTVRASAGTGFRAPSPYELYAPYGAGNPKLTPEKSRSFDLGVERRFGKDAYLKATAFWLSADNLIDYSNASYSYIQVPGTSRRSGIEVEGQTRLGAALVTATYTYTDSSVNASSSWASVPRDVVSLRASAPVSKKVTVDASARAGFGRSGGLANYAVAGLGLSYAVTDRVSADLRVDNLFDARYQLVKDYQMPRRSIYVGLRAAF
ncbi:MAG: TonB-dependent receptor [Paracoccaceae bacterium]|nr:TonB-dependent receptor [Paracoccaceae bacterium]